MTAPAFFVSAYAGQGPTGEVTSRAWWSNATSGGIRNFNLPFQGACSCVCRQQPWCAYSLHLATFGPPAFVMDALLAWLLFKASDQGSKWKLISAMIAFTVWLTFTKVVKLIPHLYRYPMDVKFIPVAIVFGYLHGFIKIYALLTLNVVSCQITRRRKAC